MHRPNGERDGSGDLAHGLLVLFMSRDDNATLVLIHAAGPTADLAALLRCFQAVLGLACDVAVAVLGQSKGEVEYE